MICDRMLDRNLLRGVQEVYHMVRALRIEYEGAFYHVNNLRKKIHTLSK